MQDFNAGGLKVLYPTITPWTRARKWLSVFKSAGASSFSSLISKGGHQRTVLYFGGQGIHSTSSFQSQFNTFDGQAGPSAHLFTFLSLSICSNSFCPLPCPICSLWPPPTPANRQDWQAGTKKKKGEEGEGRLEDGHSPGSSEILSHPIMVL